MCDSCTFLKQSLAACDMAGVHLVSKSNAEQEGLFCSASDGGHKAQTEVLLPCLPFCRWPLSPQSSLQHHGQPLQGAGGHA